MATCCRNFLPRGFKEEVKLILKFSWPIIITNYLDFVIPVISLFFLGHYDEIHLAAGGLALSFSNLCGIAIIYGLDTATGTLCSQSYGAKNFRKFGIFIQRAIILQLVVIFSIMALWINTEKILTGLGQDKHVSKLAGQFILWRIPGFVFQGMYKTLQSYLICQQISLPLIFIGLVGVIIAIAFHALLVSYLHLGVVGSAIAIDVSYVNLCIFVCAYIFKKKIFQTWPGWSSECFFELKQFLMLALPGSLMILFDWGSAEVGIFLMGLLGKVELATQTVIFNLTAMLFMVPLGISIAATVKVGHFLGAGEVRKAQDVAKSSVLLFCAFGLFDCILVICSKNFIGYIFSNSSDVINMVTSIAPLTGFFHILDGSQGVLSGILRGLGLQKYGAITNFIGFDIIGLPLGAVFGLVLKLSVIGFWGGLFIGMASQVVMMVVILALSNWEKLAKTARKRVSNSQAAEELADPATGDDTEELILGAIEINPLEVNEESDELDHVDPDLICHQTETDSDVANEIDIIGNRRHPWYIIKRIIIITSFPLLSLIAGIVTKLTV